MTVIVFITRVPHTSSIDITETIVKAGKSLVKVVVVCNALGYLGVNLPIEPSVFVHLALTTFLTLMTQTIESHQQNTFKCLQDLNSFLFSTFKKNYIIFGLLVPLGFA